MKELDGVDGLRHLLFCLTIQEKYTIVEVLLYSLLDAEYQLTKLSYLEKLMDWSRLQSDPGFGLALREVKVLIPSRTSGQPLPPADSDLKRIESIVVVCSEKNGLSSSTGSVFKCAFQKKSSACKTRTVLLDSETHDSLENEQMKMYTTKTQALNYIDCND